jgi:PAS domain S-box-containing protein
VEYCKVLELLPDGSALRLVAGVGWQEGLVGQTTVSGDRDSQAGFTLLCRDPVIVEDLRTETRFTGPALLRDHGVVSGLSVIIGEADKPFGVLGAHTARRRVFTPDDVNLLQSVANILAVAIQRKRAEEELRRAAVHLANVTAVSPAVLYTMQFQGDALVPTWVSGNVTALVGFTVAEALQPDWWSTHIHPDDRASTIAETARPGDARDRLSHEYRFLHKDGRVRWIRDELRLLRDEHGAPREIVGAWIDITERRQLEEQFLQAQKMETVGRLAGGVAHDFNNLLTVITNAADLALQGLPEGGPLRTDLMEIRRASERAASLTHQLLAFSRRQVLRLEVLDLNASLVDMEKMLPRVLGEDIDLVIVRGQGLGNVKADPGQLAQIILNLAVNSRDAMPAGGTLTIATANVELDAASVRGHPDVAPGPYVLLAVTDTGVGMDEATRERVFEPFFTTKVQGQGTGLGLSTVYGIVKQTGGHIWVTSEVGKGTAFRIYFPPVAQPVARTGPAPAAGPARGTETILVVEDEAGVRKLVKRILEMAGYTALVAQNAGEALSAVQDHRVVHLLLTDVVMPGMSGPELAERLQALQPGMKLLFMSGYTENANVLQRALSRGAPFIGKPFDTLALTWKVREVLDS